MLDFLDWDFTQLGERWGWKCERPRDEAAVVRALQRGAPVAVFQDVGRRNWWEDIGGWPPHFERIDPWPTESRWHAMLIISARAMPSVPADLAERTIVYRPPTLALG